MSTMALSLTDFSFFPTEGEQSRTPARWIKLNPSVSTHPGVILFQSDQTESGSKMPSSMMPGLLRTLRSLEQLIGEVGEDEIEDGESDRPTNFAYSSATSLICKAGSLLATFPSGSACADGLAGIRVTWRRDERQVRLVVAPTNQGRGYIYIQDAKQPRITDVVTHDSLAGWLSWLDRGSEE